MTEARPSLLWPTRRPAPLRRWDLWALPVVYALAVVARWSIRLAHPYTAEASHFVVARDLWHNAGNVRSLYLDLAPDDFSWFFWQRPLLSLLYWPAASFGWEAYRTTHLLVGTFVPVVAALLLRRLNVHAGYAYGAAAVLCLHPVLVPWSVLVLPDTTVCLLTLLGLLAAHHGRVVTTATLLLAAAWVKEVGFVTPLALGLLAWWRDADGTRGRLWPLEMGRFATLLLLVAPLSFAPLVVSMLRPDAVFPGFRLGGETGPMLERLFLLVWLAPLPLLGLRWPASRRLAAVALAWPAFFLAYHYGTGKAVEVWYNVVPATLTLLAVAAALSALQDHLPRPRNWVAPVAGALLATLLAVQIAVPQAEALNQRVATPLTHTGQWDLQEALASENAREDDLYAVLALVPPDRRDAWITLDLDWSLVMYPMSLLAHQTYKDYTGDAALSDDHVRWWANAVETRADATFVFRNEHALNEAIREAYAPCARTVGQYTVVQPQACQAYGDRLVAAYHRHAG